MCYSIEVQLITGLIILISCIGYYFYYSKKYRTSKQISVQQKWLKSFLNWTFLSFICIGLHQFLEFLSLATNNQLIYKLGLIVSLSSMYFMLNSLEILTNKNIHSGLALLIISGAAFQLFLAPLSFQGVSFYVRHNSVFFWASTWMFLFIYWNICAVKSYFTLKDRSSRKSLLLYLFAVADFSFILSIIYVLFSYFYFSINVCSDAPSIWCTFFVIQAFLIPLFLSQLPKYFHRPEKRLTITIKETIKLLAISFFILLLLFLTLPYFDCLTWKFVFP